MKITESLPSNQALVVVSTSDARLFIKTATHLRLFSHGPNMFALVYFAGWGCYASADRLKAGQCFQICMRCCDFVHRRKSA